MSKCATALCTLVVNEVYGELASKIFETLASCGRLDLGSIVVTSRQGHEQAKAGLATLAQHGLIYWHTGGGSTSYEANLQAAYKLVRLGKYVELVEDRFGLDASVLIRNLISSGLINIGDTATISHHVTEAVHGASVPDDNASANGADHNGTSNAPKAHHSYHDLGGTITALTNGHVLSSCRSELLRPHFDNWTEAEKEGKRIIGYEDGAKSSTKKELEEAITDLLREWTLGDESSRAAAESEVMLALPRISLKRAREPLDDAPKESPKKRVRFSEPHAHVNGDGGSRNGANGNTPESDPQLRNGDLNDIAHVQKATNNRKYDEAAKKESGKKAPVATSRTSPVSHHVQRHEERSGFAEKALRDKVALRIAYRQLDVLARNEMLVCQAAESLGEATSRVYASILRLGEGSVWLPSRGLMDVDDESRSQRSGDSNSISTDQLAADMKESKGLELPSGVSTENPLRFARTVRNRESSCEIPGAGFPDNAQFSEEHSDAPSLSGDEADQEPSSGGPRRHGARTNDQRHSLATKGANASELSDLEILREHLFMLCEHTVPFLIYQEQTPLTPESWIVPYQELIHQLRLNTLFSTIHARYDDSADDILGNRTAAVRVARMLHERGKLDDRALAKLSMINPKLLRARLASMHDGGAVCVQEIPRDAQRSASRTIYLWFFDEHRCAQKFVEDAYQSMTRLLQRMQHERALKRHVLEKAERSDVRGKEAQWLSKQELTQLTKWREFEHKVWSQIARLDDLVALLKDW